MINVGVIGLGMMGSTHLDVYSKLGDAKIIAISDILPERLHGTQEAAGNIKGQAKGGFDRTGVKLYDEGMKLIADPEVQLVDICLRTPQHLEFAKAALAARKHVLVEKPLARTSAEARKLAKAAAAAKGLSMCAMCMRFWPGWTWLKNAVDQKTYGRTFAAQFRRVASHPGGPFYSDGDACGGAILDLHIHDTDFVQYCFGIPNAVTTRGYSKITNQPDHVVTQYHYDNPNAPAVCLAEGGWSMTPGFNFTMQYTVNFERATAVFDLAAASPLMLYEAGQQAGAVPLEAGMGYQHEIVYFLDCIAKDVRPQTVTLDSAADSVRIVEAEAKSMATGKTTKIKA